MKISLSVNTGIINKEAFDGCQKGFNYRQDLSVDRLANTIHKGYAICAAQLKNAYRLDANFISATSLILDFDNSKKEGEKKVYTPTFSIEEGKTHPLAQYCVYAYTSFSHTNDWHKFRMVFGLPYEIEDKDLYKSIVRYVAKKFNGADMTATSCTNIFFGNTNAIDIIKNEDAQPLPESLINEAIAAYAKEKLDRQIRRAESDAKAQRIREELTRSGRVDNTDEMVKIALTFIPQRIIGTGTYENARDVAWSLAAHYGATVAASIMESHSPSYGKWDATRTCEDYDASRSDGIKSIGTLFAIAEKFGFRQSDYSKKSNFTKNSVASVSTKANAATAPNPVSSTDSSDSVNTAAGSPLLIDDESKEVFSSILRTKAEKLDMFKIFHPTLATLITEKAKSLPSAPEMISQPLLSICSGLVGTTAQVQVKTGYKVPVILWTGIIGDAGGMKTPSMKAVLDPLVALQTIATEKAEKAWEEYEEKLDEYNSASKKEREEKGLKRPEKPEYRDYFHSQFTMEGLIDSHAQEINRKGFSIVLDELAGLFGGMDQYKSGGKGDSRQVLLTLKGGGLIKKKIKGDMSLFVPRTAVSITGGIQPDVLLKLMGDRRDDDGLWGRFQWSYPEFVKPTYSELEVDISEPIQGLYEALDAHKQTTYTLDSEAQKLLIRFTNWIADELAKYPNAIRNALSKLKGEAPAYACVLHILDSYFDGKQTPSTKITESAMRRALRLCMYYFRQVQALHGEADLPANIPPQLVKIVELSRQVGKVSTRDLIRKRICKTAEEGEQLIARLSEFDLGFLSKSSKGKVQWTVFDRTEGGSGSDDKKPQYTMQQEDRTASDNPEYVTDAAVNSVFVSKDNHIEDIYINNSKNNIINTSIEFTKVHTSNVLELERTETVDEQETVKTQEPTKPSAESRTFASIHNNQQLADIAEQQQWVERYKQDQAIDVPEKYRKVVLANFAVHTSVEEWRLVIVTAPKGSVVGELLKEAPLQIQSILIAEYGEVV